MLRRKINFGLVMVVIMAGLTAAGYASPFVPIGQTNYNNTINLTEASPDFYTNFGPSEAGYLAQLWAVAGYSNTPDAAHLTWYSAGNLALGDYTYQCGSIFYHFQTTGVFNGGTVANSVNYQGGSNHSYIATTTVAPTTTNNWNGFSITPYDKEFYTNYWGEGVYTVNIPVGVSEFWVVLSKPDGDTSNNSYQRYLDVQANIIPIPEPATMALFSLCGLSMRMIRARKR